MITRKRLLMVVFGAAAASLPFAASAQIANPDNDSAAFFKYVAARDSGSRITGALPRIGELSAGGLYVYTASDRGWEHRTHAFELVGGRFAHTADCLAYDSPKPVVSAVPAMERGIFGDHAA